MPSTKLRFAGACGLALLLPSLLPAIASGFSSGPPNGFCGDPPGFSNCTVCHTSFPVNSGAGSLSVAGLPETYTFGELYALTVSIEDPDPARMRWGFELTVITESTGLQAGVLANTSANTQVSAGAGTARDYIKHTSAGTFMGQPDGASWNIQWTAPTEDVGAVHFYFASNAANGNSTNQGDYIYTGNILVPAPAADADLPLVLDVGLHAVPNPAPGRGSIVFALEEAMPIVLQVLDASGRRVRQLVAGQWSAGEYSVEWDGRDDRGLELPAGVYYTRLSGPQVDAAHRIVMIR